MFKNYSVRPKEKFKQRVLGLERLELDKEEAIHHYTTQIEIRRKKFTKKLVNKELKERKLVLRYNNCFENRKDGNFIAKWEGHFLVLEEVH